MGGDPLSNIASPPRLEEEKGNIMKDYYKCPCCENHVHVNELEEYVVEGKVLCSPCLDKELPMYNIDESLRKETT